MKWILWAVEILITSGAASADKVASLRLPLFSIEANMMTSSNIFRVTGHLCGEFTGPLWIPRKKASDAALWCFFDLRLNKRSSKHRETGDLRCYRAHYDVTNEIRQTRLRPPLFWKILSGFHPWDIMIRILWSSHPIVLLKPEIHF